MCRHHFAIFQGDITVNDFHCNIFIKQTKMRKQYLALLVPVRQELKRISRDALRAQWHR